jgi:hypothetical protein
MSTFNPDQALAHFIELHEKWGQEIDRRPDLGRMMDRGHYDFTVEDEPRETYVAASKPSALARVTAARRLFTLRSEERRVGKECS